MWVRCAFTLVLLMPAAALAQSGWGMALVGDDIFYADLQRGRVAKVGRDGASAVLIDDVHCHSLAPGWDGSIYGEAVGTNRGGMGEVVALWRIAPGGRVETIMSATTSPAPGLWIARDADGNTYSWHGERDRLSQIVKRSPAGTVAVVAGSAWGRRDGRGDEAQFGFIGAIAATADGVLYLTDTGRLRRITPDGSVETVAADFVSQRTGGLPAERLGLFNHSVGLAVGAAEAVYAVDAYNLRVVRWDAANGTTVVRDASNRLSRLTRGGVAWVPRGVAVDAGEVYVLEALISPDFLADVIGTPRIRRVSADGRATVLTAVASPPLRAAVILVPAALIACVLLRRKSILPHH